MKEMLLSKCIQYRDMYRLRKICVVTPQQRHKESCDGSVCYVSILLRGYRKEVITNTHPGKGRENDKEAYNEIKNCYIKDIFHCR